MYEQIRYTNHHGKEIVIGDGEGIYINSNDLRNYSWDYTTGNNKIKSFYKKIEKKSLPLVIMAENEQRATQIKNMLMNYADEDIEAQEYGKIWVGDYYLLGYITESKKADYNIQKNFTKIDLKFVTDQPFWTKDLDVIFRAYNLESKGGFDFSHDYNYDFWETGMEYVVNDFYSPSNFKMIIYGYVESIDINIGGNVYNINKSIPQGEYAVIDSRQKKAYIQKANGEKESIFHYRNRKYDLFRKIPVGKNYLVRGGNVDITFYDERSEPVWT
jgi:hypothetical protein